MVEQQNSVSKEQIFEAIEQKSKDIKEAVGTAGISATGLHNQIVPIVQELNIIENWYKQYIDRLTQDYEQQVRTLQDKVDELTNMVGSDKKGEKQ